MLPQNAADQSQFTCPTLIEMAKKYAKKYKKAWKGKAKLKIYKNLKPNSGIVYKSFYGNDYTLTSSNGAGLAGFVSVVDANGNSVVPPAGVTIGPVSSTAVQASFKFAMSVNFQASQIAGMADLMRVYAEYKIKKVEFEIIPLYNTTAPVSANQLGLVTLGTSYTDDLIVTNANDVMQLNNCKSARLDRSVKYTLYPKPNSYIQDTTLTSAPYGAPDKATWIHTGVGGQGVNVPHYGVKAFFEHVNLPSAAGGCTSWVLRSKYFIYFKGNR